MNFPNNQNADDSGDSLAQKIVEALRKSGCEAWLGCPPPEDVERLKAQKAERDALMLKNRILRRDKSMVNLKERARRILKGDIADE